MRATAAHDVFENSYYCLPRRIYGHVFLIMLCINVRIPDARPKYSRDGKQESARAGTEKPSGQQNNTKMSCKSECRLPGP